MVDTLSMLLTTKFTEIETSILTYLVVINIISFIAMGVDKKKAQARRYRISENTLMALSAIGGASGVMLGMIVFKHKTSKPKFYTGVPILYILNQIIIVIVFNYFR